jgi:parvulin-like peptidyl-prolyl isomerase
LENPASPINKAMAEAKRIANEQAVRDAEMKNLPEMKQLELKRYEIDLKDQVDNRKITSDEAIAKLRSKTDEEIAKYNAQNRKSSGTGETNVMTD